MTATRNAAIARALLQALPDGLRGQATRIFVGREINDLPLLLADGELPVRAATGRRGGSSVLVVATNRRVLVIDRERHRRTLIDLEYGAIDVVRCRKTGFTMTMRDGREISVDDMPKPTSNYFADWLSLNLKAASAFSHVINVQTGRAPTATTALGPAQFLPGGLEVKVVGESFHAEELRAVVGPAGTSFGATLLWASLVPDSENPYDPNAVKVMIDGRHVGHLSAEAAAAFGPVGARIRELGCDARCAATIVGGGRDGYFGVVLDLGTPDACLKCLKEPEP